ncbi:MAG: hypothetical protein E6912_11745 [Paeniclostridium sordellii]|nr:hypothetical protein [Paeniclostridium sordellii]
MILLKSIEVEDILELALPIAKQLGIDKAILSCESINIASKKVIKANNGILFNTIEENGKIYNQFVINL